jgi:hypothetical protein
MGNSGQMRGDDMIKDLKQLLELLRVVDFPFAFFLGP